MVLVFQILLLPCLTLVLHVAGVPYHLIVSQEPKVLEIGTNFTATCTIVNTTVITADDLFWNLSKTTVAKEQYTKINSSALNVTITITEDTPRFLLCLCKKDSLYVRLHEAKFMRGIFLNKGYPPEKPENLSCIAQQEKSLISPTISCEWETKGRQTENVPTTHTLFISYSNQVFNKSTSTNKAQVTLDIFPSFMSLEIWVMTQNKLGQVESDHLVKSANSLVKTNPPSDVKVISESTFPSSLFINWTCPISKLYIKLVYQVRFCPRGSNVWTDVPLENTAMDIHSIRLQNLQPDTDYIAQLRCKYYKDREGYWSDWSANATQRTPQDKPSGIPDLWRIVTDDGTDGRQVQLLCKDPKSANGRIIRFDFRIQDHSSKSRNGRGEWESIAVNRSEGDRRETTFLKRISLPDKKSVTVHVIAVNSVGSSPEASMDISAKLDAEHGSVQGLRVWPHEGKLLVEWKPIKTADVKEYLVEWTIGDQVDWQRESDVTTQTTIKGSLEPFVCYNISVYPIYSRSVGKAARVEAFLEEKAPAQAPEVILNRDPGWNKALLVWNTIPDPFRRGFITHYTLFYGTGAEVHQITVPANATSYTLTSLSSNTKYSVWIEASTIKGSKNGSKSYFTTMKYAPGEIEGIVVGVSLSLIFVVILTMLLCFYKRDMIKENFWPQIPNPRESTIGNWSPDYSLKAETPKENCTSGISVLDMCDAKGVFEEDKTSLGLKKDKYLSEEHSSGIGGSSRMSSPRQSVSDSDEGSDIADTTASTVQYSSVVASSGYKGQTPSSQAQQTIFSRSESEQPLLDSEENPDVALEGCRPFQHSSQQPCLLLDAGIGDASDSHLDMEMRDVVESRDFCPLEENVERMAVDGLVAAWLPAARDSSYMPQLGGYRPQ